MDIAYSIDPDQPKHVAQANPDRYFSPSMDFLFQESLLYTSILLRRNVSARICMRGLRRLFWVGSLRKVLNVDFLVEWFHMYLTVRPHIVGTHKNRFIGVGCSVKRTNIGQSKATDTSLLDSTQYMEIGVEIYRSRESLALSPVIIRNQ